jgi:hypothetical protein
MARTYRTLGELRAEMRAMTGFAASGSAAGANATLIDTHLRNAQVVLYWTHDWAHLRSYDDLSLGASQYLVDYPADANPDRVKFLSVYRGSVWSPPIPKGIPPQFYTTQDNESYPQRWEPYEQIEVWPKADQAYTLRAFYIKALSAFTADGNRASLDDNMISIVATATLKAHYRHPDAAMHKDIADALIIKLKGKSWGQSTFRPGDYLREEPLVKPETV